ncbi:Nsp1-like C-terminal region-domain-containing protein [Elsinoe ampelina]|uniref:Nucleoporin NSP1 n=1 Tax=Elsinoe ampelina TaxID=302913 RepID=A0A6A6G1K3_9PEZI|nr:Nsp1-like C-terminal region-domain-containing protein [Elsinoe ampelina]
MSNPPKFTFGAPASSAGSSGGLFGSSGATKPLFGQSTGETPKPASTGLFGSTPSSGGEQKSLFGGGASTGGTSFGFGAAKPTEGSSGGGLFGGGAKPATPGGFSFTKPGEITSTTPLQTPSATSAPNMFGQPSTTSAPASGGLFGNLNNAASSSQPASGTATPAPNKPAPLSFSTTPAGPPPSSGNNLFGGSKPAEGGSGLFGQKSDKPASSPFGQPPSAGGGGGGLFGAKSTEQPASAGPTTPSFFGGGATASSQPASNLFQKPTAPASATAEGQKPTFSFPSSNASKPLFGEVNKTTESAPAKPSFSLGQPAASKEQPSPATTTPSAPTSLFSLNKPATTPSTSSAPTSTLFSQNKDTAATPASSAPTTSFFNKDSTSQPQTSGSAPSGGLFKLGGLGGGAATSSSSTAPASTATTAPTTSSAPAQQFSTFPTAVPNFQQGLQAAQNPGASTTGPAPPAASRLAAKSLDEILTLWTTSLTTHQKSFGNMATRISAWDRQLVENSDKISKLYARTFQAERDTAEVERQLTSVEGEQQELERYLDQYEKTVDELIARSGGVEGGIDAERERTYRIAERCSSRLTSMSHDLTSMIEEINAASANVRQSNKSANASDPLTQIVKVLNGHLSQLQLIDQGASQLQQKVTAAQREARAIGRNGALGNDEVDAFARSYLGRR